MLASGYRFAAELESLLCNYTTSGTRPERIPYPSKDICCEPIVCVCVLVPLYGVQRDGSRLLHVLPQQHLAMGPIQVGHLDARCARICPVQLVMDPVDGQST